MTDPRVEEILGFWLGGLTDKDKIAPGDAMVRRWFVADEKLDAAIRERFGADVEKAAGGQLDSWRDDPRGRLALIILCDQFSRNIFRDTARMYATDPLALELSLSSVEDGTDSRLTLIERKFIYMPLMHSEDISVQELSVRCFKKLVAASRTVCPCNTPYYEYTLGYARKHHDDVKRDGRFVYRDKILKRV